MTKRLPPPPLTDTERAAVLTEYGQELPEIRTLPATERAHILTARARELEEELRRTASDRVDAIADLIAAGVISTPTEMATYLGGLKSPGAIWTLFNNAKDRLQQRRINNNPSETATAGA